MMAVEVMTEPTFSAGTPRLLYEGNFQSGLIFRTNYDSRPDGQRFVMIQEDTPDSETAQIHIVQNCFEELKRRVPK